MTLPYVWYRTSVWIPLGVAVNNFWGFLVIFWKVPAIVRPAAYRAKLEPPLGRPHLPLFSCELFSNRFFFFFSSWLLLHERWQPGCWWFFSVHLIPFFFFFFTAFYFLPPHCHSTVTGTYLWDICRKVGISMWKGSCRQCYALCIHSICMKCSRCHSC